MPFSCWLWRGPRMAISWNYLGNGHQSPDPQRDLSTDCNINWHLGRANGHRMVSATAGWLYTGAACKNLKEKQTSPVGQDLATAFTCSGASCKNWKMFYLQLLEGDSSWSPSPKTQLLDAQSSLTGAKRKAKKALCKTLKKSQLYGCLCL